MRIVSTPDVSGAPAAQEFDVLQLVEVIVIKWAIVFAIISVIAGFFGYSGVAADSAAIAKVLFFIALVLFAIFVIAGIVVGKKLSN